MIYAAGQASAKVATQHSVEIFITKKLNLKSKDLLRKYSLPDNIQSLDCEDCRPEELFEVWKCLERTQHHTIEGTNN